MASAKTPEPRRILNRKARHTYHIHATVEGGLALLGTEVKSLRAGQADLSEAYVRIHGTEVVLYDCQIDRYPPAADRNHEPRRKRRVLLHGREIRKLAQQLQQTGTTLVPLSIFFNARGLAKIELALVTGKKLHDKREDLRKREHQREIDRATRRRPRP